MYKTYYINYYIILLYNYYINVILDNDDDAANSNKWNNKGFYDK